jgi:hypothetical protein
MKIAEILAIVFGFISAGCLGFLQLRGEGFKFKLKFFYLDAFKDASKIELDAFDKRLVMISAISFVLCVTFIVINYW